MPEQDIAFAREVGRDLPLDALPAYAPMLAAYHRSHSAELRAMIKALPLYPGDQVLDMACGAGVYTRWLAERVAPQGSVIGIDISSAYLAQARAAAADSPHAAQLSFQTGDIDSLPFNDDTFDFVWCAQSMYSLPDAAAALRELRRVTRPGGSVAVFENDVLHHLVLPWPVELELAVRQAHLQALAEDAPNGSKPFIGRDLRSVYSEAGLQDCIIRPYSAVRQAPLSADESEFLTSYLDDLRARARPYLEPVARAWFDQLINPGSALYMLNQPDFCVTYIEMVACGRK